MEKLNSIKALITCPNCGYSISVKEKILFKCDIECPDCGKVPISLFETETWKSKGDK